MSCGAGFRCSCSDTMLLWLWGRLAAAAPIRPLVWEAPYAMGVVLKRFKKKKKKKRKGNYSKLSYLNVEAELWTESPTVWNTLKVTD